MLNNGHKTLYWEGLEPGAEALCNHFTGYDFTGYVTVKCKLAPWVIYVWNKNIDKFLTSIDFTRSTYDSCYVMNKKGKTTYLALYVDDILLASECEKALEEVKVAVNKVKDLGVAKKYLKINNDKTETGIKLSLRAYIENMLHTL